MPVIDPVMPAQTLEEQETLGQLRAALMHLRPEEKEVFLLRQNGDLTYEQIAELHNRRLVAWHSKVATNNHTLTLSLAAFRTNITAIKAFNSDGITNALANR